MSLPRYKSKKTILELTSLIDVMFLLLIFFMLTMPDEATSDIPINLPSASGVDEIEKIKIYSITVTPMNRIVFEDKIIEGDALLKKLEQLDSSNAKILIRGDAKCDLGATVNVWQIAKKAGFKKIGIAVQK